jgi:hypothetical protein
MLLKYVTVIKFIPLRGVMEQVGYFVLIFQA